MSLHECTRPSSTWNRAKRKCKCGQSRVILDPKLTRLLPFEALQVYHLHQIATKISPKGVYLPVEVVADEDYEEAVDLAGEMHCHLRDGSDDESRDGVVHDNDGDIDVDDEVDAQADSSQVP